MKIYDISQEVFSCKVFPGDPAPERQVLASMQAGELYNLTALSMCAHNGTHLDAPFHFFADGKTVEQMPLEKTVGACFVATHDGALTADDAAEILSRAKASGDDAWTRILLKGSTVVTQEAARVFRKYIRMKVERYGKMEPELP